MARLNGLVAGLAAVTPEDGEEAVAELARVATEPSSDIVTDGFRTSVERQCEQALERLRLIGADARSRADEEFLAQASLALAGALGAESVRDTIVRIVVPRFADWCSIDGTHLGAPAPAGGDVVELPLPGRQGVITTLRLERTSRPFDLSDRALADEVAARAAQALDAAIAYDEQTMTSMTLQRSLLPHGLVPVPGLAFAARYVAATATQEVGGDFYDAIAVPGGGAVLMIGDVQGKGIDAAALTSAARHTLRAAALEGGSPCEMLRRVNAAILYGQREQTLESDEDPRFVTAAIVTLRPQGSGFTADAASGGHPPPLLVRANGHVEELRAAGMVLGVVDDPQFTVVHAELSLADTIVLYTDGVTEQARYLDFDEAELGRLVRNRIGPADAEAVAELILDTVLLMAPGQPRDDLAVLVACVTG